jgi:hypothetical protein
VVPKFSCRCPLRKGEETRDAQGESHAEMEAESGGMHVQAEEYSGCVCGGWVPGTSEARRVSGGSTTLLMLSFQTSGSHNCERVSFVVLSHPVCGTSLQ